MKNNVTCITQYFSLGELINTIYCSTYSKPNITFTFIESYK